MSFWVLDDGPLGTLAEHYNSNWSWPAATLHVVEDVASGASQDKTKRRQSLLSMKNGGRPVIEVHKIMADSATGHYLFEYLRPSARSATKNLGEDASIAYCSIENTDAIFVTKDKAAAFSALAELGIGRVATPFDLWNDLLSRQLVSKAEFSDLCDSVRKSLGWPRVPRRLSV